MDYRLFGKPIRSKLPLAMDNPGVLFTNREDAFPEIKELRTPWEQKEWPANQNRRGRLGACTLSNDNIQWKYYLEFIRLLQARGTPAVFYTPPRNFTLLEKTDSIDYPRYRYNSELAVRVATEHGIKVLRYDHAVDSKHFTDIIHTTAEGNRILARKIARDLLAGSLPDL